MIKKQVVDLTKIAQSFIGLPEDHIQRENLVDTIYRIFEGGSDLVIVDGQDGIGKTTLLTEFATKFSDRTLSLFIRPNSPLSYDPDYLRMDLCNQLHWLLYNKDIDDPDKINPSLLGKYVFELQKLARVNRHPYYVVIDGLDDIPVQDPAICERIIGMIPLNSQLHFLIAADKVAIPLERCRGIRSKPYTITGFSPDETRKFLSGVVENDNAQRELHYLCKGIPGYLASAKRSLQSGVNLETLLSLMPTKQPDLFNIEWEQVSTNTQKYSLAIITFGRRRYTTDSIASLLDADPSVVDSELRVLSFIKIDECGEVAFTSETFRSFAESQLSSYREIVAELVIKRLLSEPDSDEALINLPNFLQDAGKLQALLDYLSPDTFIKMLERTQSLTLIQRKAEQGIIAAEKLDRNGDVVRFSAQRSTLVELDEAEVWRSEIDARMALRDYDAALALAQSSVIQEHRLQLLALIAKEKIRQGQAIDQELVELIRQLCSQIDKAALGEKAVDIASDLLYVSPELAIDLVEGAATSDTAVGRLDWAFAQLSLVAMSTVDEQLVSPDIRETLRSRIKDPAAQRFTSAAALLFGNYSADTIISEAEKRVEGEEGLFLLRQWTRENADSDGAAEVIDYALKLAVKTTTYTPKARDFREIATPLPNISDASKIKDLVSQFDSQMASLKQNGPTHEYVRLQLLLAVAEQKYDFDAASDRILGVYIETVDLLDVAVKTECLVWLLLALPHIDPDNKLETTLGLHKSIEDDFANGFAKLLDSSADHVRTVRNIIRALAKERGNVAVDLCGNLNTQARRDNALLEVVSSAVNVPANKIDFDLIEKAISSINDAEYRDEAVLRVIERCYAEQKSSNTLFPRCLAFLSKSTDLLDPGQRCIASSKSYSLLKRTGSSAQTLIDTLRAEIETSWNTIDVGWHKVNIGFMVVRALVDDDEDLARNYMDNISNLREYLAIDSEPMARSYIGCCKLAIRAYIGLFGKNLDHEEDFDALKRLIKHLPSNGERSVLWAELALRCYSNGRIDQCKDVVSQYVIPSYEAINDKDTCYKEDVLGRISPALFCHHSDTAIERIVNLPCEKRDDALLAVAMFILQKHPSSDPYDSSLGRPYPIDYNDAVDLCKLMDNINRDAVLYYIMEAVTRSILSKGGLKQFSREQIASIAKRFEDITASKLPDPANIQHQGYVILAHAQIARLKRDKSASTWSDLLDRSRSIPNTADRALVMGHIAKLTPSGLGNLNEPALEQAKHLIDEMPDILDKLERYEELAIDAINLSSLLSRECLKTAVTSACAKHDPDVYAIQRRLVDLAYKINPDFASRIAELVDTDLARASARENITDRLKVNKLREGIIKEDAVEDEAMSLEEARYPQASWMLLAGLNSGKIAHKDFDYTRKYVKVAAKLPISQSYPILSWIVQNAVVRYGKTPEASNYLRPLFDAMVTGASLTGALASRSMAQQKRLQEHAGKSLDTDEVMIIQSGEREKAMSFLRNWFQSEVTDYLLICDPYFAPDDLEAIQLLLSVKPQCKVRILTSAEAFAKSDNSYEDMFRNHWRQQLSGTSMPRTVIVVARREPSGKTPFHDRWWVTKGSGLDSGTSFNAWGGAKVTSLSFMTPSEAASKEIIIESYLQMEEIECDGESIKYSIFNL